MSLAPIVATQLTDHSSRAKTLTVGGIGIELANPGNNPGVPIETVAVTEAGPGGVSSMSFSIEDVGRTATVQEGMGVEFWNVTLARPIFAGYVSSFSYRPRTPGRWIDVRAVGVEALLDWLIVPSLTIPAGTTLTQAIQSCAANTEGVNPLRAFGTGPSKALPVGGFTFGHGATAAVLQYAVVLAGQTLREAIRTCSDAASVDIAGGLNPSFQIGVQALATVDFWYGLLCSQYTNTRSMDTDYADLTLTDTVAGALAAEDLNYEVDATSIVRGVYIAGGNAAGTGVITDGSGLPGRIAYLSDSTIDSATKLAVQGSAYIASQSSQTRGSLNLTDYAPTADVYVGSRVLYTDSLIPSQPSTALWIMQIDKTFNQVREDWSLTYGGLAKSAARYNRRVSRLVRS